MSKTYVSSLKKDAVVNLPLTTADIAKLHAILLKQLDEKISLDNESWDTIESMCHKIDECAKEQNLTEFKEVNF